MDDLKKSAADGGSSREAVPDDFKDLLSSRIWNLPLVTGALCVLYLLLESQTPSNSFWMEDRNFSTFLVYWDETAKALHSNALFGLGLLVSGAWFTWICTRRNGFALAAYLTLFLPYWGSTWVGGIPPSRFIRTMDAFGPTNDLQVCRIAPGRLAVIGPPVISDYLIQHAVFAQELETEHTPSGPAVFLPDQQKEGLIHLNEGIWIFVHDGRARFSYDHRLKRLSKGPPLCGVSFFDFVPGQGQFDSEAATRFWNRSRRWGECDPRDRLLQDFEHPNPQARSLARRLLASDSD